MTFLAYDWKIQANFSFLWFSYLPLVSKPYSCSHLHPTSPRVGAWRHHHVEDFCSKFHQCSASRFTHLSVRPNDKQLPLDIQGHLQNVHKKLRTWGGTVIGCLGFNFGILFPKMQIQTIAIFSTSFRSPARGFAYSSPKKNDAFFSMLGKRGHDPCHHPPTPPPTPSLLGFGWNFAPTDLWIGNFQLMVI